MTENIPEREDITEYGEQVYSLFWDSGGPGGGAEYEYIYRYQGYFYPILSYDYDVQPYSSLGEALRESELSTLLDACEEIEFPPEYRNQIMPLLNYAGEDGRDIRINGEVWFVAPKIGLKKISTD